MCEYCQKQKRMKENEDDNICFYIWGKHLQMAGKIFGHPFGRDVIINYCPMCGRSLKGVDNI